MITLTQSSNQNTRANETANKPTEIVETAGSLAMLFNDGLLTVGQYDEFITNNPFMVDYSMYSDFSDDIASSDGGFLSNFSNAVATLGTGATTGGGGFASFSGSCGGGSCGGFTSVC